MSSLVFGCSAACTHRRRRGGRVHSWAVVQGHARRFVRCARRLERRRRVGRTRRDVRHPTADAVSWTNAAAILEIDADANPATGNAGGAPGIELSYVLHSLHDKLTLDRSNGESTANPAATATLSGATLTIAVPFAELGPSDRIGFFIATPGPSGADRAPNAGEWQLSPNAAVTAISPSFSPATPRRGHTFALTRVTTRFSDGTSGTAVATCTARLGTVRLAAGCRWRLRANARGKKLTVVVRAAGLAKMVRFTVR